MSLILEALRKSEAERRRAQAPDLLAEPQLALPPPPRRAPPWMWPALGAAGLVAIFVLARAAWPPALPVASSTPVVAPTPVAHASTPIAQSGEPAATPIAATAAPPRPGPPAAIPAPVASRPSPPAPAPSSSTAAAIATTPASAPPPVAPQAVTEAPATATIPAPAADTMRLSDLDSEERRQLPALKLSMHLWNDAPAQRFVILDGQRLGEGDRIGDAVVEQITREGAILAWNGRRLSVSMR